MRKFTLEDLQVVKGKYFFPNSPVARSKEEAENVLVICNYIGRLDDTINSDIVVKIIEDISKIKNSLLF